MTSSDSEDFESADEGQTHEEKKGRKKRNSSSNFSDKALEADLEPKGKSSSLGKAEKDKQETDGWDDFDIEEEKQIESSHKPTSKEHKPEVNQENVKKDTIKSQDTGWDDFEDWGQDDGTGEAEKVQQPKQTQQNPTRQQTTQNKPEPNIEEVAEKLAQASTKSSGWGWGWGVDSLLSTATAGITTATAGFSTLTSQVSQGISTVLETGIGAPDPEELARKNNKENESGNVKVNDVKPNVEGEKATSEQAGAGEASFPFGSLLSGVTKFVETTGTKVIAGGLDTLETIGKKTMEVLQEGDPGLAKKRAMLGLDSGDKPVLSQILREAKAKADEEDKVREEKREAKEVHYENLFDDFEGLVHLEALEMLSRQVSMRIEERMRGLDPEKRQDIKETLQQVSELCEMPEEEEDDEEPASDDISKSDAFHDRLQTATQDLGLKLQFLPLVKQYTDILTWLESSDITEKALYKRAVSGLAQCTALSVEIYHKSAEMLLVKPRRSTADEADALTQMTVVLTKHISELATLFTEKLNTLSSDNKDQINTYITNIFLEAGNSSTYIQNAFQLALPILQIGAV